jgi:ribosomal protein L32
MAKKTQIMMNQSRLPGGKKPPRAREYPRADDVFSPGPLTACDTCGKEISPHHCDDCPLVRHREEPK